MAAIVTNNIKEQLLQTVLTDVADSANYYYIGIGRSDQWDATDTVPTVGNSEREKRKFRTALQSIIRTTDTSFVAPRYNWTSGSIYSSYNDAQDATTNAATYPFYVLTDNQRIYLCMQQGKSKTGTVATSSVNPDTTGTTTKPKRTSDGYIWKYLYTLGAVEANKFLSANYVPVKFVDSSLTLSVVETVQKSVQDSAVAGSILGFTVVSPGAGYSTAPTVEIFGDETDSAEGKAYLTTAGGISKVELDSNGSGLLSIGAGYSYASVTLTGGSPTTPAVIRPIVSLNGLGKDPRDDLQASAIMFNAKPAGVQNNNFMVGQDFRQIGLIKNPLKNQTVDSNFTGTDARAMNILTLTNIDADFDSAAVKDALITGSTSGAKARGDELKGSKLYYHFTESDGFKSFRASEDVFLDSSTGITAEVVTDSGGTIKPFSGEVLYIENRSAVERNTAQTEDIKIIVQL